MISIRILITLTLFFSQILSVTCFAQMIYQNFENDNGTPHQDNRDSLPIQYGWGFNGAIVQLSTPNEPVHSGTYSWAVTVPQGPKVHAGTAVVSATQSFHMNFIEQCYDRISFWVWSDPSEVGDHTVMLKFFDHGQYQDRGVGIWTKENQRAKYREWTRLEIFFSDLPRDFDLKNVVKVEFFNYWDGTYFYDDIFLSSGNSPQQDRECLSNQKFIICPQDNHNSVIPKACVSIFDEKGEYALDFLKLKEFKAAESTNHRE